MKDFAIQLVDHNDNGNIMDIKVDPVYDTEGKILSGLVIGNTLMQNKALILMSNSGEIKSSPTIGVGLGDATLGQGDLLQFRHKIRKDFASDGLKIITLDLYNVNNINIEAIYE